MLVVLFCGNVYVCRHIQQTMSFLANLFDSLWQWISHSTDGLLLLHLLPPTPAKRTCLFAHILPPLLQLDASHFTGAEWPRIREGISIQTYEVLLER